MRDFLVLAAVFPGEGAARVPIPHRQALADSDKEGRGHRRRQRIHACLGCRGGPLDSQSA